MTLGGTYLGGLTAFWDYGMGERNTDFRIHSFNSHIIYYYYFIGGIVDYSVVFQASSKMIQLHKYSFFFRFSSHVGYHRVLSRVPCARQ